MENILSLKALPRKTNAAVKSLLAVTVVALSVVLPQLVHAATGAQGGAKWLPMYLPVLLGGCLLGQARGVGIGMLSPLVSFCLTAAFGHPMPALARLPFLAAELAVFGAVSGAFAAKIAQNARFAFPAVLCAQAAGRSSLLLCAVLFSRAAPFTPAVALAQIVTGLAGIVLQAAVVPLLVIGLRRLWRTRRND